MAAVIWVGCGAIQTLWCSVFAVALIWMAATAGADGHGVALAIFITILVTTGLIGGGAVLIREGRRTLCGVAGGILSNAVGSLLFGLWFMVIGFRSLPPKLRQDFLLSWLFSFAGRGLLLLTGIGLFVAGILALLARRAYSRSKQRDLARGQ
jgi:hypothetical protein